MVALDFAKKHKRLPPPPWCFGWFAPPQARGTGVPAAGARGPRPGRNYVTASCRRRNRTVRCSVRVKARCPAVQRILLPCSAIPAGATGIYTAVGIVPPVPARAAERGRTAVYVSQSRSRARPGRGRRRVSVCVHSALRGALTKNKTAQNRIYIHSANGEPAPPLPCSRSPRSCPAPQSAPLEITHNHSQHSLPQAQPTNPSLVPHTCIARACAEHRVLQQSLQP